LYFFSSLLDSSPVDIGTDKRGKKERKNENSIRINSEVHCKTVYQDWYIQPEQNQIYSTRYKRNYVVREELFVQFLVAPASNPEAKYSFSYD
jgi:hypothetical protein